MNPCFDTDFVEIVAPTLLNYDYIVFSTALLKTHPAFTVNFSPEVHALCGVLSYSATFDSGAVTTTSKPFAYFDDQLEIVLYSEDSDLIDTVKDYVLTVEFTLFPQSTNS